MIPLEKLYRITSSIPVDIGGGSSFGKLSVMAELAEHLGLRTFIEIGVYRGRSFIPLASFFSRRGGYSYGIDPYTKLDAREEDLPEAIAGAVNQFFEDTDYEALYCDIILRQAKFGLLNSTQIIRQTSQHAAQYFRAQKISVDMIHIDGNHDTKFVMQDVEDYIPLLKSGGILVLDDVNWESVKPALDYATNRLTPIYLTDTYAVLLNSQPDAAQKLNLQEICLSAEAEAIHFAAGAPEEPKFKVSVSIVTYNQEAYIGQAIESALNQETDFDYEIVIGEDASTDLTRSICRDYKSRYPHKIRLLERPENLGAVRNYLQTYEACQGKYVAFLEGDDFWTDPTKLQRQVDFLEWNPDYAICFHNVYLADKAGKLGAPLFDALQDTTTVNDLCNGDFISTPSCMIRNRQVREIPAWLYEMPGCDWPFDILNAEFGKIKCLPGLMAAYRMHDTSLWSSLNITQRYSMAIEIATNLNRHFGFRYEKEFGQYIANNQAALLSVAQKPRRSALRRAVNAGLRQIKPHLKRWRLAIKAKWKTAWHPARSFDLVIVDDAYPHPQSAFRLEEYDAYLEHFKSSIAYTTGSAFNFFREKRSVVDVIRAHEAGNRIVRGKIEIHDREKPVRGRLAYTIFAGNAWENIEYFERNHLPFVFTLYPGGSFYINDAASDERLRRVFESTMFRRVIVTQNATLDYLLKKKLCPPHKIEFIYGVVTPRMNLEKTLSKRRFGFEKSILDICFIAHKYTSDGRDKGYDLFLTVAKRLVEICPECRFHVVGGFDAEDLPIDGLEEKITFYGGQTQEWLSQFYRDKDIILLCNVPFVIHNGAFDGFPTGCGSDAMLNGLALFSTDPLRMNLKFVDGRDLVIVPHDADTIIQKLIWYQSNPSALRDLAENGKLQARKVYGLENQMRPRITILEEEIKKTTALH